MLKLIISKRVNINEFLLVQSYKDWMLTFGRYKESRFTLTEDEFKAIYKKVRIK